MYEINVDDFDIKCDDYLFSKFYTEMVDVYKLKGWIKMEDLDFNGLCYNLCAKSLVRSIKEKNKIFEEQYLDILECEKEQQSYEYDDIIDVIDENYNFESIDEQYLKIMKLNCSQLLFLFEISNEPHVLNKALNSIKNRLNVLNSIPRMEYDDYKKSKKIYKEYNFINKCLLCLCENENACDIIKKNVELLYDKDVLVMIFLNKNNHVLDLCEQYMDKIDSVQMGGDGCGIELLYGNTSKHAIKIIERYWDKHMCMDDSICHHSDGYLFKNEDATYIVEKHFDKLLFFDDKYNNNIFSEATMSFLCLNKKAVHLVERILYKLEKKNWEDLCRNENAVNLLEKHQDKINWTNLSINPSIFDYDYKKISKLNHDINKDLIEWTWKPSNIDKWKDWGL